jgi:CheY-like chemotaxis protein
MRVTRAAGCTIPAIALTAHAMESDVTRALDAGFNVHLAKPVHFERLISTIGQLMSSTKIPSTS